jgi:hypothetical protein
MRSLGNKRGSIAEFAVIVPLVISATIVVMQLMLLITQRSQNHAMADRIAFLAATAGMSVAAMEADQIRMMHPAISTILVSEELGRVKVVLNAEANLFLPIAPVKYQISATAIKEP